MRFCTECGTPLHENENFCRQCGTPAQIPVPVQVVPQKPQPPKKPKKQPQKLTAGRTVFSVILCVFLLAWTLLSVVMWDVRSIITGDALVSMVGDYMAEADFGSMPAQSLFPEVTDPEVTVVEWFIRQVSDNSGGSKEISQAQVDEFMKRSTIPAFVQDKVQMLADLLNGGEPQDLVTRSELEALLEENAPLAESVFDIPAGDAQIEYFLDSLEETGFYDRYSAENVVDTLDELVYSMDNSVNFSYLQFLAEIANNWVTLLLVLFVVLAIGFAVLLALVNRWDMVRTAMWVGIPLVLAGGFMTVVATVRELFSGIWASLPAQWASLSKPVTLYLRTTLTPALVVLAFGFLLICVYVAFRVVLPKVRKTA